MKTISKITIGLTTALLLFSGCGGGDSAAPTSSAKVAPTISEESLGLRKTNLYVEAPDTTGVEANYSKEYPGGSHKIKRAFQDAPPMIPHDVEGMLPIKIGANQCTGCHLPKFAKEMGATPIPESHFTNFRPTNTVKNGLFQKEVDNYKNETSIKKTNHLQGARFNCSQCHAPQSKGDLDVANTFKAAYTKKDGAEKSSWNDSEWTKSLDTIKGGKDYITPADIANKNSPAGVSPWTHH